MTDVLLGTGTFPPMCSGGGWCTYYLAKALDAADDIDVTVLAVNQDEVKEDGLDIERISVPRFPNEIAYAGIARELRRREDDYDVVQAQHSLTVPALAFVDAPTVGRVWDYWPICYRTTLRDRWGNNHYRCGARCLATVGFDFHVGFPYKVFNHHLRAALARRSDLLVAGSHFVEDRLNDRGIDNTDTVHTYVPADYGDSVEPEGEGDVLFVGKLNEQKGPQLLMEAIPSILEDGERQFTFLGKGPLREWLEKRARELGVEDYVDFRGHVPMDEVSARMKGASVVVFASLWYEPLGRVVMEAQALGTPVISTGRGGNSEALAEASTMVEPTSEGIASGVKEALGKEGRVSVENPFTEGDIVEEWRRVYETLI